METQNTRLALLRAAKSGDRGAEEAFVSQNLGLVQSIVSRFAGLRDREELFQIGCLGLVTAIRRFDFTYNVAFSTYAVPVILGEIRQFLRRDGTLHVSRAVRERVHRLARVQDELVQTLGRAPTVAELAAAASLTADEVLEAENVGTVCSLSEVEDVVRAAEVDVAERADLSRAMDMLSERERRVLLMRFSLDRTQSEVARTLGVSQAQVSRLERSAVKRLQKILIGEEQ